MSDFLERISKLSPKRLALLALELQSKVEALESQEQEPIAVIGMACRFPGKADTPETFWKLLCDSVDAIVETPAERWDIETYYDPNPDAPGKIATRWGGFLEDVDQFDPDFFGIAPREAVNMDPQQRLMLEVGWEALESAGYAPDELGGSKTGVFLGICSADYYLLNMSGDKRRIDAYLASGSAGSVASGRLSYLLGLQGPAVSVDTACSSSLVAVHLACQSLRGGESQIAVAGGVNIILQPEVTMTLSRAHMMAADGRCKAFDARADGFVRAEGCGLVVLKRLSEAVTDGDRILALIRGSAMNQDGRSSGLTAPNGPSQEAVIRQALAAAGIQPQEVDYVEAHGTGTSLGDPIEVRALGAALCQGRPPSRPLIVGSVKTNIGHLESTAGIAGLMKVVLALQHGEIPAHLHLKQLNPHVNWSELPIVIPTERRSWPVGEGRRIAGVSSFGFSGTNAHVVLEEAPGVERKEGKGKGGGEDEAARAERPLHLLTMSAKSEEALQELAGRYAGHLGLHPEEDLADVSYTANVGRAHFGHRLAVVGESAESVGQQLAEVAAGKKAGPEVLSGVAPNPPEIAFLFTGQGSQYVGMGKQLYETQPTFRKALERCEEILRPQLEKPLLEVLYPKAGANSPLDETEYTQPALFALEYGLAELWKSWGIEPSVVMGHSVGEYVAACVAGLFSLEDGLKLIATRGRLMQGLGAGGQMVAVFSDESRVRQAIAAYAKSVSIAAINGPENVVISGAGEQVQEVVQRLEGEKIKTQRLVVSHAFHSPLIEPMLEEFERVAGELTYREPRVGLVSNVTGEMWDCRSDSSNLQSAIRNRQSSYWRVHVREAVQFEKGMETLAGQNCQVYLEIGPSPVLLGMGKRCVSEGKGEWLPSLRKGREDWQQMLDSLGRLYVEGARVDWVGFDRDYERRKVSLPTYPFQRQRYWIEATEPTTVPVNPHSVTSGQQSNHPLLLGRLATAVPVFEGWLSLAALPYMNDHRVYGAMITPGALLIEMVSAAAIEAFGEDPTLESLELQEPLVIPDDGECQVQVVFTPQQGGASFQLFSRISTEDGSDWKIHAIGKIHRGGIGLPPAGESLAAIQHRCSQEVSPDTFYQQLAERAFQFGPTFRSIRRLWRGEGEALGEVVLEDSLAHMSGEYQVHPVLLDGCIQVLGAAVADASSAETYLQTGLQHYQLYGLPGKRLWSHARLRPSEGTESYLGDLRVFDEQGGLVAEMQGVQLKQARREMLARLSQGRHSDWFYEVVWEVKPLSTIGRAFWLPPPAKVSDRIRPSLTLLSTQHGLQAYDELAPRMDAVSAGFVIQALRRMGWAFAPGRRVSLAGLAAGLKVITAHRRLLERMLGILEEEGLLKKCGGDEWEVVAVLDEGTPQEQCRSLLGQFPDYSAALTLLDCCGARLAETLQGSQDPLQLLFPNGDFSTTERLYQESPSARVFNQMVQEAVVAAIEELPKGRTLRILEIGAGTGATTSYVIKSLPPQTEYVFTDVSPLFPARAEEKFRNCPFMRFQTLDIEQSPLAQGFAEHSFDLILAANVLHATRDLGKTFSNVRQLLASEGMLVLLEGTSPQRWVDLTFGLTEGWWRFSDWQLRPSHPLLSQVQWKFFLGQQGFTGVEAVPERQERAAQSIVLARGPQIEGSPRAQGCWLILADGSGVGDQLVEELRRERQSCILVHAGAQFERLSPDTCRIDPGDATHYDRLVASVSDAGCPLLGIVHAWSPDGSGRESFEDVTWPCWSAVLSLQALLKAESSAKLWLVTRGSQPVGGTGGHPAQSPLWGLGRVMALEHPEQWGGQVDLDPSENEQEVVNLASELLESEGEDQVAYRTGDRLVPRLVRSRPSLLGTTVWHSDGSYLITGGLGGLGLKLAQWMARQGAGHLMLMGRRGLPERALWKTLPADSDAALQVKAIEAIEATGAKVTVARGDASDAAVMRTQFSRFGSELPPLRGVIHAAVEMSVGPLKTLKKETLESMLRPKVAGTWNLHRCTEKLDLDFFLLFSSTTALWGARDLGHYAAANLFLEGMAHWRHSKGLPALAINWGTWDVMRVASGEEKKFFASGGLNPMPSDEALEVLGGLLGSQITQLTVASVNWDVLKPLYESRRKRPFFDKIESRPDKAMSVARPRPELHWTFDEVPAFRRREVLASRIRTEVAKVLGKGDANTIDSERGLFEMGMDSLMSVELKSRLETCLGKPLPSTLTFNYPNVAALTDFIGREVLGFDLAARTVPESQESTSREELPSSPDTNQLSEEELEYLLLKKLEQV